MSDIPFEWNWTAPRQVVFGWGRRRELGSLLQPLARRVWLIPGSRTLVGSPVWAEILANLKQADISVVQLPTQSREPLVEDVDRCVTEIRHAGLQPGDAILAIGGGSAIDLGKAVSGLVTQQEFTTVVDYLEGVGTGKTLTSSPLPFIVLPTTAGTGSEATRNAVISSLNPPYKKSLRSPRLVPELVILDPELTVTAPRNVTVWCGMDALTQLLESLISCRATPQTDRRAFEGLQSFPDALRRAARDPLDQAARQQLAYGAYLSGLTLANGGLGIAHGLAAALGIQCQTPHGLACAVLLPLALRLNFEASLVRLAWVGRLWSPAFTGTDREAAEHAVEVVSNLLTDLNIPVKLRDLGVRYEQLPKLVAGSHGNSRHGNPIELNDALLLAALEEML